MNNFRIIFIVLIALLAQACTGKETAKTSPQVSDGYSRTGKILAGTASWYGGKFHGRRTACGEIYNKNALTAAHKTLPFGTILEVTNPTNNKTIHLRVTDRGPFIKGRILDVSQAAAEQLDFKHHGTAKIVAEIVVPVEKETLAEVVGDKQERRASLDVR